MYETLHYSKDDCAQLWYFDSNISIPGEISWVFTVSCRYYKDKGNYYPQSVSIAMK
jgi:hypothetical protein